MRTPASNGRLRDHISIATAAKATAGRSQFTVALRASAGARATSRASQGRRRWVRATHTAITAAQAISMPALTIQYICSRCWTAPDEGVSHAATCMKAPVSTGYSRYCMPPYFGSTATSGKRSK